MTADPGSLLVQVFNQNRAAPDDLIGWGETSGELGRLGRLGGSLGWLAGVLCYASPT